MTIHTLGENARWMMLQAGTLINGAGGGTANGMPVGQFQNVGSNDQPAILVDVNANGLNKISPGTQFTHVGAYGTVESSGTWRGALFMVGYNPRVAPPGTTGLGSYGTYLA
jgi:hypothetical protein